MNKFFGIIIVSALLVPFFVLAGQSFNPGTDEYLQNNGLTESQLTTNVATENRDFFASTTGETTIKDPIADVLSRTGTHPLITNAWGDLTEAKLTKDNARQCWSIALTVAAEIPQTNSLQVNFLIYMDGDDNTTNNAPEGVRAGTDKEFSIKNSETGWNTDYRWYNSSPNALTWAINKKTASTFSFEKNVLNICIPFSEVAETITPIWRAAAVIYDGTNIQIDVAPSIGFPPPKGETYSTWKTENLTSTLINWQALKIISGIIILVGLIKLVFWFVQKKKAKK